MPMKLAERGQPSIPLDARPGTPIEIVDVFHEPIKGQSVEAVLSEVGLEPALGLGVSAARNGPAGANSRETRVSREDVPAVMANSHLPFLHN